MIGDGFNIYGDLICKGKIEIAGIMNVCVMVENLKIFAYHGCMDEEEIIGSDYVVNITASCMMSEKAFADDITKTVDYVD